MQTKETLAQFLSDHGLVVEGNETRDELLEAFVHIVSKNA